MLWLSLDRAIRAVVEDNAILTTKTWDYENGLNAITINKLAKESQLSVRDVFEKDEIVQGGIATDRILTIHHPEIDEPVKITTWRKYGIADSTGPKFDRMIEYLKMWKEKRRMQLQPENKNFNSTTALSGSNPPDHSYVVFARLPGLEKMANDEISGAVLGLSETFNDALNTVPNSASRSSVYGRFAAVPRNVVDAVNFSKRVMEETARRGIHITIGIAGGRLESVRDLKENNLTGSPINMAARLAFLSTETGWIAADHITVQDARVALSSLRDSFEVLTEDQVKRTKVKFHKLKTGELVVNESQPTDTSLSSELAHIVAYDIVSYSEQELRDQSAFAELLRGCVERSLEPSGGKLLTDEQERWYSPGGDGGVLVFRSGIRGGARSAWSFARSLRENCRDKVPIRIGIASGQVVILPDGLPIGLGILQADSASGFPDEQGIGCNKRFWDDSLEESDRSCWSSSPSSHEDFYLINPN